MTGEAADRSTLTWDPRQVALAGPRQTLRAVSMATPRPEHTEPHRRALDPLLVPDGDYRLGPVIGEGGMGTVSSALQRALGRQVALKRLRPAQAADPALRARFLAEAALTADLAHPQVVPVHDLGCDADGMPFYTMKLVSGRPWDEVMHLLDLEQNLRVLLKVCDAVAHAHSKGVLHRDLKPDNIMVGDFGEVLVLDWGLAVAFAPGTRAPRLGPDTPLAGTPAFMPPECACGEMAALGPASDVYLLGALLHVVLTGHPPHPGEDAQACLRAAAGNLIDPPPPQDALGAIAARAMSTRPGDRQADVRAFQHELRTWREHRDSLALAREARLALARAMQRGSHQLFLDSVHGCEEALRLWDGNQEARALLATARRSWALTAAERGDYALAESQLDPRLEGHAAALATVRAARLRAERERRRSRRLRGLLAGAAALLALGAIAGVATSLTGAHRVRQAQGAAVDERERAARAELAAHTARAESDRRAQRRAEAFPSYAEALDLLARGQLPVRAAALLRAATATDPGFTEAWYALGEALRLSGRPHQAAPAFLEADRLSRETDGRPHLLALAHAGLALQDALEHHRAAEVFRRLEELGGDDPLAQVGAIHRPGGHYRDGLLAACAATARAAAAAPHLWECQLAAGHTAWIAVQDGYLDPAQERPRVLAFLRLAHELAPAMANVTSILAGVLREGADQAERDEGERLLDAAAAEFPADPYLAGERVNRLQAAGRSQEAQRVLREFRALDPPPAYLELVEAQTLIPSEPERAFARLLALVAEHNDWPQTRFRAIVVAAARRPLADRGWEAYRRWCAETPDHPLRRVLGVLFANDRHDVAGAAAEVDAGLALAPWNIHLVNQRAALSAWRLDGPAFIADTRRAIAIRPGYLDLRRIEIDALMQLDRRDEARAALWRLMRDFPRDSAVAGRLRALIEGPQ